MILHIFHGRDRGSPSTLGATRASVAGRPQPRSLKRHPWLAVFVRASKLKTAELLPNEVKRIIECTARLSHSNIHIDDSGSLTLWDLRSRCRKIRAEKKRLDLVVVDYLQLMQAEKAHRDRSGTREREIAEISGGLKTLAKELGVPVIALAQLNRGVESRLDKRPLLGDVRDSGAVEQDADIVCFLYRDEVYNTNTQEPGIAELIVAKHRSGSTKTIKLRWHSEYTYFSDLSDTGNKVISLNRSF